MTTLSKTFGLAALLSLSLAAPACAQVQQGNPNAVNQSMSTMSTNRAIQQEQTGQTNTLRMDMQRSQNTPPTPTPPAIAPRGAVGR
jgi:protein-disulfide isomerase